MIIKIQVDNKIILRKVKHYRFGNFVMNVIRYKNNDYLIGDGDEYLRGYEDVYTLGKQLKG